jgi:hypothetical protein
MDYLSDIGGAYGSVIVVGTLFMSLFANTLY